MTWKKHSRKISDIEQSNREFTKEVDSRFNSITSEIGGTDQVIDLNFLKEHLSLSSGDDDALTELKYIAKLSEKYEVKMVSSRKENRVYVQFPLLDSDEYG